MRRTAWFWLITIAIVLLLPLILGGYWVRLLTSVWMYAIMALSVNIIAGYAGYPALGNTVFFGTGAYVVAVAMNNFHLGFPQALVLAGVGCALYAILVGLPVLRLTGRYFLMATLGLLWLTREIVTNLSSTGGGSGINVPVLSGSVTFVNNFFYYLMLGLCLACVLVSLLVERSRFGYALRAIRHDEEAANIMGIASTRYKVVAWGISAFFTGLAGGAFAYWMTYIDPQTVFDIATSLRVYLMFIFGGAGTVLGPIIGAAFIEIVFEQVWTNFLELHYLILGILVIAVTMFMPQGLVPVLGRWMRRRSSRSGQGKHARLFSKEVL